MVQACLEFYSEIMCVTSVLPNLYLEILPVSSIPQQPSLMVRILNQQENIKE